MVVSVVSPVQAQIPPSLPPRALSRHMPNSPSDAQRALIDQIQGVGPLKFGVTPESLGKDALIPAQDVEGAHSDQTSFFQYLKAKDITWGTLHPSAVELRFRYNQLLTIRLIFNETVGDLLVVRRALVEKYGPASGRSNIQRTSSEGYSGPIWNTERIQLTIAFPEEPNLGETIDFDKKTTAVVELIDQGLWMKQSKEKLETAQKKMLEDHDLEKIKADL